MLLTVLKFENASLANSFSFRLKDVFGTFLFIQSSFALRNVALKKLPRLLTIKMTMPVLACYNLTLRGNFPGVFLKPSAKRHTCLMAIPHGSLG